MSSPMRCTVSSETRRAAHRFLPHDGTMAPTTPARTAMKRKVMLTCAVTGENAYNPRHPAFPVTPEQIADAALEAERAGASAVHLHVREPDGRGSRSPELFKQMVDSVRARGVRAVLNVTCGGGAK